MSLLPTRKLMKWLTGFSGNGRSAALSRFLKNFKNVVRSDFPDRKFADGGKNYTLKHIQSPRFGDFGPVFPLQPLFGNQLKGVGCVVDLADLI